MSNFLPDNYEVPERIEKHMLYNGEVELMFREFSKPRYTANGVECLGVTSIIREVIPKHALVPWAVKKTADYILENYNYGQPYSKKELEELVVTAKKQHRLEKEKAGDIGTEIHKHLEAWIRYQMDGGEEPKVTFDGFIFPVTKYKEWEKNLKIEYVKSEAPVYSREHNYAGTLDAIAIINGRKSLLDFKTSNYIYFDQYMMQVAAYELAYTEESGDKIEDRYIIKIPKTDKFKFEIVKLNPLDVEKCKETFPKALHLARELMRLQSTYKYV